MSNKEPVNLVLYADGSARPNPGFGGYGLIGYSWRSSPRDKNTKHPVKASVRLTSEGFQKDKGAETIEVLDIYEAAIALPGETSTNNIAELQAAIHAMRWALELPYLAKLLIYSDSKYVVMGYTKYLPEQAKRGYKGQHGVSISNLEQWLMMESLGKELKERGVAIELVWVKGHNGNYGNEMADLYSVIASNAARLQSLNTTFSTDIINSQMPYAQYKKSYPEKDPIYYFKDVFFSSADVQDSAQCVVTATKDETNTGRRTTDSIYLVIEGEVPEFINRIKAFYRTMARNYVCTCSIKLMRLENRDVLRVAEFVEPQYLLLPIEAKYVSNAQTNTSARFSLIGAEGVFLQENTMDYPFIVNVDKVAQSVRTLQESAERATTIDVTELFLKKGKLTLSTRDKFIDLSSVVQEHMVFTQRPILAIGLDVPSYLALKRLESTVTQVEAVFDKDESSNFYTLFTKFTAPQRQIYSVNTLHKYLALGVSKGSNKTTVA